MPPARNFRQPAEDEEPSTVWSRLSQVSIVGIVLLLLGGLLVPSRSKWREFEKVDAEGRALEAQITDLERQKRDQEKTLRRFDEDANFAEAKVRDGLVKYREGEVVFQFQQPGVAAAPTSN